MALVRGGGAGGSAVANGASIRLVDISAASHDFLHHLAFGIADGLDLIVASDPRAAPFGPARGRGGSEKCCPYNGYHQVHGGATVAKLRSGGQKVGHKLG